MIRTAAETIIVAFSMFSAIPVPHVEWTEKNMRFSLLAFPLVGVFIALAETLWAWISMRAGLPELLRAAVFTAIPILITGGIHLDGYLDVSDALASCSDAQKRQEILKDPHIGSFAAIRLAVWMLLYFGFASGFGYGRADLVLMGSAHVLVRCLSGLAVASFPLARSTGLAYAFRSAADKGHVRNALAVCAALLCVWMAGAGWYFLGWRGMEAAAGMILVCLVQFLYLRRTADRMFGGLSGDLNGWFLQKAELWMLAALVILMLL